MPANALRRYLQDHLAGSVAASPAAASEYLGDFDVTAVSLKVNGRGEAMP